MLNWASARGHRDGLNPARWRGHLDHLSPAPGKILKANRHAAVPVGDAGGFMEALRGRPLPQRAQEYGYRAGLAVLAGLFVFATWNDLTHLGLFRWVSGLMG